MATTTTDSTRTADYNTIHDLRCKLQDEDSQSSNEFDSARASLVQYITPGQVDWAATRKAEIADLERRIAEIPDRRRQREADRKEAARIARWVAADEEAQANARIKEWHRIREEERLRPRRSLMDW